MVKISFITLSNQQKFVVEGILGASLMEVAVQNNVSGITAECGGACSCATCHVIIDKNFIDKIPSPDAMELDMLDFAHEVQENSRLACQIIINENMVDLVVYVPNNAR